MNEYSPAITAFLEGVRTGEWQAMELHYRDDATFKGTVPRWHFTVRGPGDVVRQMEDWFPFSADVSDLHIMATEGGAVVEFERHWQRPASDGEAPEEVGVRQAHIFFLDDDGRIREQHGHCAGIWDAETFASAAQAAARN